MTTRRLDDQRIQCHEDEEEIYCLNGGTCKDDAVHTPERPCDCPAGTSGANCQIVLRSDAQEDEEDEDKSQDDESSEACNLACEHGGTCQLGPPPESLLQLYGHVVGSPNDAMHCACRTGYAGKNCEYEAEICGDDQAHVCLHGSNCVLEDDEAYTCECASAYTEGSLYAGSFCQHHHTDRCTPSTEGYDEYYQGMAVEHFCVNNGECVDVVLQGDQLHSKCKCPPLYTGPHCEFLKTAEERAMPDDDWTIPKSGGTYSARGTAASFFLILVLAAIVTLGGLFLKRQIRKRRNKQKVVLNLQSFRDENFGATSANGSMLFPSMATPPVHSDWANHGTERMHDVDIS